ncbi:MAG: hypothetical protein AAAB35_22990 [Phyllobacterium sp.]|uniref:hypothetical protein n=1 Tax=Phyllobacterium sp. TaxID=1871046 RepID=UPI0030F2C1F2
MKPSTIIDSLASIAVVIGVPLFFAKEVLDTQRERRQNALHLAEGMQAEQFSNNRQILLRPWLREDLRALQQTNPSRDVLDKLVIDIIETDSSRAITSALYDTALFFRHAQACIDSHVCDNDLTTELISPTAFEIYRLYAPAYNAMADKYRLTDIGREIKAFAEAAEISGKAGNSN